MEEKQEYSRREARRQQRCQGGGGVKTEEEEEEYEGGERGEEDIWIWNNEFYLVLCERTKARSFSQTETNGRDPPCHHGTIMSCA